MIEHGQDTSLRSRGGRAVLPGRCRSGRTIVFTESHLRASAPRKLFGGSFLWLRRANFDVAPKDARFVIVESKERRGGAALHVVLNWFQEPERLAPPVR